MMSRKRRADMGAGFMNCANCGAQDAAFMGVVCSQCHSWVCGTHYEWYDHLQVCGVCAEREPTRFLVGGYLAPRQPEEKGEDGREEKKMEEDPLRNLPLLVLAPRREDKKTEEEADGPYSEPVVGPYSDDGLLRWESRMIWLLLCSLVEEVEEQVGPG
jgi:hypothetical protein